MNDVIPTSRAAVLGSPIAHSLSPTLYRAGFAALGLTEWAFAAIDCDADGLAPLLASRDDTWRGFAVTMPGKQAAARAATTASRRVRTLGVANTLIRQPDGWHAENTDVDGVVGSLRAAGVESDGTVLLLGGGGTACAVIAALAELRWSHPLLLAGRRAASTDAVADVSARLGIAHHRVGMTAADLEPHLPEVSLVISAVPAHAADLLADLLAPVPALMDVIYHPWPTALAAANPHRAVTMTGLDMLLHQALRQFELVTGQAAPAEAMRSALRKAVGSDLPLPVAPLL